MTENKFNKQSIRNCTQCDYQYLKPVCEYYCMRLQQITKGECYINE